MRTNFNPWPLGILSFFVLLICSLVTVVIIASTHRESMVSENYYEQELKFQDQIDGSARAQKAGANIKLDAAAGKLKVAVPAGQAAQKFSGVIDFYRPSSPDLDRELTLAPSADGSQSVDVSKMATGLWQVRVKWTVDGQTYFLEQKVVL